MSQQLEGRAERTETNILISGDFQIMWAQCLRIFLVVVLCSLSAQAQDRIADETSVVVSLENNKTNKFIRTSSPPGGAPTSISGRWNQGKGNWKNSGQLGVNVETFL